jgi:hypothetical protein
MRGYLATKTRLDILLNNSRRRPSTVEDLVNMHFWASIDMEPMDFDEVRDGLPYWVDFGSLNNASDNAEPSDYLVQYREGIHEPKSTRSMLHSGYIIEHNGESYEYIDSIRLPVEVEIQADDGKFCHAYRGESFLRVFERVQASNQGES